MKNTKLGTILLALTLGGCGAGPQLEIEMVAPPAAVTNPTMVVRGSATLTVSSLDSGVVSPPNMLMHQADQVMGVTTNVVYNNAPEVLFTLNTTKLVAGTLNSAFTLSLGYMQISALVDNTLEVCGPTGNMQCTDAIFRVYTLGNIAGLVNTTDPNPYGAPIFVTGLNPKIPLTLNEPGVELEDSTIGSAQHLLRLSNFPTQTFYVTSDFTNAGSGSYSSTIVFEYVLTNWQ